MMDWRELEKLRWLAHLELRGVQWKCNHVSDMTTNPTDSRGPGRVNGSGKNHKHQFTLDPSRLRVVVGTEWHGMSA